MDTIEELRGVFADVFTAMPAAFGAATTPADIEQWDSTAHVSLILAIESRFGLEFTPTELGKVTSVGAIRDLIEAKLG
ncbi:MAG: acyl carrier protein [Thiohalocapsa sp.]